MYIDLAIVNMTPECAKKHPVNVFLQQAAPCGADFGLKDDLHRHVQISIFWENRQNKRFLLTENIHAHLSITFLWIMWITP